MRPSAIASMIDSAIVQRSRILAGPRMNGSSNPNERLEAKEDEELRAELEGARREWEREGGRDAGGFLAEMDADSPE